MELIASDILIFDRNPAERTRIDNAVSPEFWRVLHAKTHEEAVTHCNTTKISIVLFEADPLDPESIASISSIRHDEGKSNCATIIAMSSFSPGAFDVLTIQAGADLHVMKPILTKDVMAIITKASTQRMATQKAASSISTGE